MTNKHADPIWKAQDLLSRRDHSEFEIRTKLKQKRFTPTEIDSAITWLYQHKLLDDIAFAHRYVESTLLTKPVGPRWVSAKLKQKGIKGDTINAVIAELIPLQTEHHLAADAARRWHQSHPSKAGDVQKLQRFLQSRGFSYTTISQVTNSVSDESDLQLVDE